MPQDPRHGEVGRRRSARPEPDPEEGSAGTGRRRRALSEDGTGGTRVIDLLSKHGKAPGGSNHRRAAEPEPPQAQPPRRARPPQPAPPAPQEPAARPPEAAPRRRQAPQNRPSAPPGWTPPAAARPPQAPAGEPRRRQDTPPPPSRRPAAGGAAAAFAGGAAARSGRPDAPIEPPVNGVPRTGAPVEPPRSSGPVEPPRNGAPAPGAEPTRVTQALGGEAPPASPPRRMRRPAPSRPVPPPVNEDLEATTQHAPVPPAPPRAEATSVVSRLNPEDQQTTIAKPVAPPSAAKPVAPASAAEETAIVAAPDDLAELDEFDELDDDDLETDLDSDDEEEDEDREADIKQIDATLARFSAVHDEIAAEEEARRKKFSWLLGKRKEPELGTDMPFDFHEGRDGQSRMEWKKKQRKRRTHLIVAAVAVAASLSVFLTLGFAWGATTFWGPSSIAALDPESDSIKEVAKQTGDQNFLLVGSDTRAGAKPEDGVGSEDETVGARSDTTMIAHIPADRSRVVLVSFPRDLQVDLPACERWDAKTGQYTGQQAPAQQDVRLNEAYAVGGPLCTTKVIQQISGLRVDSFLGIDFNGFKSMVDAVQGVEICTEKPIVDSTLGTVIPTAGKHTISGDQALNYVRARHVEGDPTSDYGRMQRQQLFLSALLRKTTSGQVLLDPGKLSGFVKAVSANTFGENVGADRLMDLGQQLQGLDPSRVTFITVPTTGYANDEGMEELREADTQALFQAILDDKPIIADAKTNQPSGGGAAFRQQPADPSTPEEPAAPTGLSTVNAGTDICG
ncbi:transcriptional attenuator, LytR family [Saccharopolyspora kobensis]|uniref:Transcriptional attenuator, LytR family n=2 Tax=Saccharopolyspora kobensis TaxID=146035 RepID=A0A1H6E018_9PSEU|nr:LCP family protein [Saccharopolyspora kobensis]SEG90948.1 transcriptional attenuator, LytR family [Saccharopolyspora kobensis]SFD95026.1 transcriptional attenuator, LytR family [Saccharopolyspora kobensis]